jgi:rare lipoprotein A (peptidoglycan hydrolase)
MSKNKKFLMVLAFSAFFVLSTALAEVALTNKEGEEQKSQKIFSLKTPAVARGWASWYGPGFQGKKMADGKRFDMRKVSVAHRSLPLGTKVKVINLWNHKSIVTFVRDRGPYIQGRDMDLSYAAAKKLGAVRDGVIPVRIEIKT